MSDKYKPSDEAQGLGRIFPSPDGDKPFCLLCGEVVANLEMHCQNIHETSSEIMQAAIGVSPGTRLPLSLPPASASQKQRAGRRSEEERDRILTPPPRPIPTVDVAAAAQHPGGLEGFRVEALLDASEKVFYRADVEEGLRAGLTPTHLVVSLAYHQVIRRRIQTVVEDNRRIAGTSKIAEARTLTMFAEIEDAILKLTTALERIRDSRIVKSDDPRQILEAEMAEAERFVQQHLGELEGRCPSCTALLTLPALPHWAFAPHDTRHGVEYMVWSQELWRLVVGQQIPLYVMAYALRTSPEGLMMTAARRGEPWPDWIVLEQAERELRTLLDADDRAATFLSPSLSSSRRDEAAPSAEPC